MARGWLSALGVAAVVLCILLGALFFRSQQLTLKETHRFQTGTHVLDSAFVELSNLRREVAWYSSSPTDERSRQVRFRFDILWSRIGLLTEGREADALREFGDSVRARDDIVAVLTGLEPSFINLNGLTLQQLEAVDADLDQIRSVLNGVQLRLTDRQIQRHSEIPEKAYLTTLVTFGGVAASVAFIVAIGIIHARRYQHLVGKLARAQEALENHVQSIRSLSEASPSGIVVFEPNGRIRYANGTFRELVRKLGCNSKEEAIELLSGNGHPRGGSQSTGGQSTRPVRIVHGPDGGEVAVRLYWADAHWYGKMAQLVLIQNLTDVYVAEQKAGRAARLAALAELSTAVAHQINQPLAVVSAAAQNTLRRIRLGRTDLDEAGEKLALILSQVERARSVTDRMRMLGDRPEEGRAPVDLSDCIRSSTALIGASLGECGVDLVLDLPADDMALADAHRLTVEHVLLVLLLNARDAFEASNAPDAGAGRTVSVSLHRDRGDWLIAVADNAGGFARSILERAFEPFVTTKSGWQNVGLGLSFCHSAIRDMGGSIHLRNAGGGATIEIRLPAVRGEST